MTNIPDYRKIVIMKSRPEVKTNIYRPLKWIEESKRHPVINRYVRDNLIQSITNPERICKTKRTILVSQLNARNLGVTFFDPKEKENKEKEKKENAIRENRKNILNQYDRLLSENQSWEKQSEDFKIFYYQYAQFFEKIQNLGDIFKDNASHLRITEKNLLLTKSCKERAAARKEGFISNINFHMKHADENWNRKDENRLRSMAIAIQIPLGIALMVLGGIVLIPTMGTFLLYLPIAIIALGAILTATALVLAYIDQHEAIEIHQALEQSISDLLTRKENETSSLLQTWKEIDAIDFESANLT